MDDLKFNGIREALSFLLKDEISAVDGYDKVLAECTDLPDEFRLQLERIRNTEIDHIKDLSNMFQHYSSVKIVGKDSWAMHKGVDGLYYFQNQRGEAFVHDNKVVKYADARQAGEFFVTNLYTADSGVPKIIVDKESLEQRLSQRISNLPVGRLNYHTNIDGSVAVTGNEDDLDYVYEILKKQYRVTRGRYGLMFSDTVPKVVKEQRGYSIQDGDFFIQYRPEKDVKFALALPQDKTIFDSESEALRVRKEFLDL